MGKYYWRKLTLWAQLENLWFRKSNSNAFYIAKLGEIHQLRVVTFTRGRKFEVVNVELSWCLSLSWWRHQMEIFFRVTGPLCGEFSGHRWIPHTKASDAEPLFFLWSVLWINGWVNNRYTGDLRRHRAHYDVVVMINEQHKLSRRTFRQHGQDVTWYTLTYWKHSHTTLETRDTKTPYPILELGDLTSTYDKRQPCCFRNGDFPYQLHEPRIFYPSGHWPETVTNVHVSAHFR